MNKKYLTLKEWIWKMLRSKLPQMNKLRLLWVTSAKVFQTSRPLSRRPNQQHKAISNSIKFLRSKKEQHTNNPGDRREWS